MPPETIHLRGAISETPSSDDFNSSTADSRHQKTGYPVHFVYIRGSAGMAITDGEDVDGGGAFNSAD